MNMSKKVWSLILLCLMGISLVLTIVIFINTGISIYQLENNGIDSSNDKLPGASVVGAALATFAIWSGLIFGGGIVAGVGFFAALIYKKIGVNPVVKRISVVLSYFFLVILVLIFGIFVFTVINFL